MDSLPPIDLPDDYLARRLAFIKRQEATERRVRRITMVLLLGLCGIGLIALGLLVAFIVPLVAGDYSPW